MIELENFLEAARLLNKYKGVQVVDLMDDVNEKLKIIFLKVVDMEDDKIKEGKVFATLNKFQKNTTTILSYAKKETDDTNSEV